MIIDGDSVVRSIIRAFSRNDLSLKSHHNYYEVANKKAIHAAIFRCRLPAAFLAEFNPNLRNARVQPMRGEMI